ncbi:MAG: hypothetical protein IAE96_14350 [Chitinophagaceae bacterium]|nr:hypothetical protein [Chitinophagaceae bacterium]
MKKVIFTVLLIFGLGAVSLAQNNPTGSAAPGTRKTNSSYVDRNRNNVCDHFENRSAVNGRNQGRGYGYGPGNGQCRQGSGNGRGWCRRRA